MVEYIPELTEAGINSLKIEGRMKTALYVATVTRAYRRAIDDCFESDEKYRANMEWYKEEVLKCTNRRYSTGFYFGRPDEESQIYESSTYVNDYVYLGYVERVARAGEVFGGVTAGTDKDMGDIVTVAGETVVDAVVKTDEAEAGVVVKNDEAVGKLALIEQRNKFCVGDTIEIIKPNGDNISVSVQAMYTLDGQTVESAPHSKQRLWLQLSETPETQDLLRANKTLIR